MNSTLKVAEYRSFARIFSKIRKKPAFERIKKQVSMVGASGDIGFARKASNTNGLRAVSKQYLHSKLNTELEF